MPASLTGQESCLENFEATLSLNKKLASSVGLEFEGAFPAQFSYYDVALVMKKSLEEKFPNSQVTLNEIDHRFSASEYQVIVNKGDVSQTYSVKGDSSLSFEDSNLKGIEITSPIMRTKQDFEAFLEVLEEARTKGINARQDVGGIHLHYGLPRDKTYAELEPLYELFVKSHESLLSYFRVNPGREYQSPRQLEEALEAIRQIAGRDPSKTLENLTVGELNRRGLLRILPTLGTFEVRFFNSTLDPQINRFYQDFVDRLFSRWQNNDPELLAFIKSSDTLEIPDLLRVLDFDVNQTDVLMERLAKEGEAVELSQPYAKELADFFKSDSEDNQLDFLSNAPFDFYEILLRDDRFLTLSPQIQSRLLAGHPQKGTSDVSRLHRYWRGESDELNFFSILDESEDLSVFFHVFHQYFKRAPEQMMSVLEHSAPPQFYSALLKDFSKNGLSSGPSQSRRLSRDFIGLMVKASDLVSQNELTERLFPLFEIIRTMTFPHKEELTVLTDKMLAGLLKDSAPSFDEGPLLAFLNKLVLPINRELKTKFAHHVREGLIKKGFDYNIFYQYATYLKAYPNDLIDDEAIEFLTETTHQFATRFNRNERVNLLLLFKDFERLENLSPAAREKVSELLERLRELNSL